MKSWLPCWCFFCDLVGPLVIWRAWLPNRRHLIVSATYLFVGDTHTISSSLASPPVEYSQYNMCQLVQYILGYSILWWIEVSKFTYRLSPVEGVWVLNFGKGHDCNVLPVHWVHQRVQKDFNKENIMDKIICTYSRHTHPHICTTLHTHVCKFAHMH